MAELTQHLINLRRGIGRFPDTFRAPARRYLFAGLLLTFAPLCQAQFGTLQLPSQPTTWSSGTNTVSASTSITASGPANSTLVINGTAQVTFIAGSQINLEPGFTATATSASTTFHAFIASAATYSIGGQVTSSGTGLSGVTVALGGWQTGSATTDGGGNYSFTGVAGGGSYTVTPSKNGTTFTPASAAISNLNANWPVPAFAAVVSPTMTTKEYIRLGGRVIAIENH